MSSWRFLSQFYLIFFYSNNNSFYYYQVFIEFCSFLQLFFLRDLFFSYCPTSVPECVNPQKVDAPNIIIVFKCPGSRFSVVAMNNFAMPHEDIVCNADISNV